ncbi:flagellar hook-associated protein FlgK [Asticcacaulis sp. EMRT-3]|uniref:flagellar hook-associated protein FlgK n=1 Tax=Asticcacaulis sp. EMRT-3 TaxID=3040349 RepID=UPI0024AFA8BD|nr:flagellar hook-associated protein FlgK [Asticcacaulis sp. EMRT-3]MDI7775494.1 flagellar hook-associated protein FlgK [Asticcacaulis sp. EMRT-3]
MSLNTIMNIGMSGLMTAQDQLHVVSDNISNVNTPGYIRKIATQQSVTIGGVGMGVQSGQVKLAADQYLEAASFSASANAGQADISSSMLDQIQSQFGDITDSNNMFNLASTTLSDMSQAAETATSSPARQQVLSDLSTFLNTAGGVSSQIQQVRANADSQIGTDVDTINGLLKNITDLNATISSATVTGQDATGAQTTQTQYLDQLSKLVDINVTQDTNGGVTVRTNAGLTLATGSTAATLSYTPAANVDATTNFSPITVTGVNGETRDMADYLSSGELKGLIDVRDTSSVAVNDQLNEYVRQFTNTLNAVHNQGSAVPAPASLTGKNTSLTSSEAVSGFTGQTNIVTLDSSGNITHTLGIDFTTGNLTLDGAAAGTFTAANFTSQVNSALGGSATVGFANGVMTLSASGSGGNDGVAVVDPATGGATKQGQGFSQFFGLNDLISSDVPTSYNTGLSGSDNSGFAPGSEVDFALKSSDGSTLSTVNFAVPSGATTMSDLVNALNDTTSGVGRYGTFSLDSNGALTFKGFGNPPNTLSVKSDQTSRNGTGASFSQFFGLGGTQGTIATRVGINQAVNNNPSLLALGRVNLSASTGTAALSVGDGSNGLAMAGVGSQSVTFAKAGLNGGGASTLNRYGSDLAGQVGNLSSQAKNNADASDALLTEANSRRSSQEGVNLDEELVNLTTYQQGYSAASRLIQAAKDMYDVLLNMMG